VLTSSPLFQRLRALPRCPHRGYRAGHAPVHVPYRLWLPRSEAFRSLARQGGGRGRSLGARRRALALAPPPPETLFISNPETAKGRLGVSDAENLDL